MIGLRAVALLLPLALATCAAPQSPPLADPRIFLVPGLPISADAAGVSVENGLMRVAVRLSNRTDRDVPVLVMTEWTDREARPMRSVTSRPRRLTVPRFGDAAIDSLAPGSNAADWRMSVEPDTAN